MSTPSQIESSLLFGKFAYCKSRQVAAGIDPSPFGGPPHNVGVAAQFFT